MAARTGRTIDIAFLSCLGLAAMLLALGLTLPAFTSDRLWSDRSFSILSGSAHLLARGDLALGFVIGLFSVVFPVGKLLTMATVRFARAELAGDLPLLRLIEALGKWSMLDVFVVATLIGAARLELISEIRPEPGIYLFAAAVVASMTAGLLQSQALRGRRFPSYAPPGGALRLTSLVLGAASLLVFIAAIAQPLMHIEKWLFWDRQYSLLDALGRMWAQGEHLLPAVIALFVIALPMARFLVLLTVRALGRRCPAGLLRLAAGLETWSMWDVYGLALIVVLVKLGDLADVQPLSGFWLLLMAIVLSLADGWVFRAGLRWSPRAGGEAGRRPPKGSYSTP